MGLAGAEGNLDRIPGLVAELVQFKFDALIAPIPGAIRAAKQATNKIPLSWWPDLIRSRTGLIDSLAHPGGNFTGLSTLAHDLSGKRLELLKEVVPASFLASQSF